MEFFEIEFAPPPINFELGAARPTIFKIWAQCILDVYVKNDPFWMNILNLPCLGKIQRI